MKNTFGTVKKSDVKKEKILEDAAKRFRMLCEYTFNITEDDGEEDASIDQSQEMDTQQGVEGMEQPMPDMGNDANNPNDGQMQQNQPDMIGDDMSNGNGQGATGFNPQDDSMVDDNSSDIGADGMGEDDEVIDVDDLTQSQEETEEKVDDMQVSMEKGFEKLIDVVSKLDKMIDASTENMEQIKHEIEKRNPTPLEKLNMRAANDSYPFNISPDDYWKEKEATSNYRIGGENEKDAPQYTITQGDIDKITDFQTISKELDDSMMNQNLLNIFGLR